MTALEAAAGVFAVDPASVLLRATIRGRPASKARPRVINTNGRVRAYDPSCKEQQAVAWQLRAAWRKPKFVDPLGVAAVFHMPTRRRMDVDNLIKLLLDAGTGVVWNDDQQVVEVAARVIKSSPEPRTELLIWRV